MPMTTQADSTLVFLSCGGTIEKIALSQDRNIAFDRSRIADWATQCRIAQPWRAETLMLIDSLEMMDSHRQQVARRVAELIESKIVIVHGTDTMVQTAQTIKTARQAHQTIVLTGAMIPISHAESDGLFNLGLATAAVQLLPPGVFIAMSGQIFPADRARKNLDQGIFESIDHNDARPEQHTAIAEEDHNGMLRITKRKFTGFFR